MFQVQADKSRQLLRISFAQHVKPEETKSLSEKVEKLLVEFQPGFALLSDLSSLETMDVACAPFISRVMDLCNDKGIATVVRVIPDPRKDIGLNILTLFHYSRKVRVLTCDTLDEAAKILRL